MKKFAITLTALLLILLAMMMSACGDTPKGTNPPPDGVEQIEDGSDLTGDDQSGGASTDESETPTDKDDNVTDKTEKPSDNEKPSDKDKNPADDGKEITAMYIYINGSRLEVSLAKNAAVEALVSRLKGGDITYTAHNYGGFEKVGSLGQPLPSSDSWMSTGAGDVMLYQSNQIVLFYGNNAYNYTKLGKIVGLSNSELSAVLSAGDNVTVRISLK